MSQDSELPSFKELSDILQKIQPHCHVSQIHGLLCGHICATVGDEIDLWNCVFPNVKKDRKAEEILKELYESTYHQLSEFSFEFTLLLPDDGVDINTRAEALGLWCQGFLTGLEQSDVAIQSVANPELKEALDDIIEIAQITFGDIASNDEDESAYYELIEYVRLSVLLVFQELRTDASAQEVDEGDMLH